MQLQEVKGELLRNGEVELAVTGRAFSALQASGALYDLLLYTRIYARFTPEQKVRAWGVSILLHQSGFIRITQQLGRI